MKKAMSSVVAIILIILISVVSVLIVWLGINMTLDFTDAEFSTDTAVINTREGYTYFDKDEGVVCIQLEGRYDVRPDRVEIVFNIRGDSFKGYFESDEVPEMNEKSKECFYVGNMPSTISAIPVYGKEYGNTFEIYHLDFGVFDDSDLKEVVERHKEENNKEDGGSDIDSGTEEDETENTGGGGGSDTYDEKESDNTENEDTDDETENVGGGGSSGGGDMGGGIDVIEEDNNKNDNNENDFLDSDGDGVLDDIDCDESDIEKWQLIKGYVDNDGDGFGSGELVEVCSGEILPEGYSLVDGDCDDGKADINPNSNEDYFDKVDNDCDGVIDCGDDRGYSEGGCVDIISISECKTVISKSGYYVLKNDLLGCDSFGVMIDADDVVLDCEGKHITGVEESLSKLYHSAGKEDCSLKAFLNYTVAPTGVAVCRGSERYVVRNCNIHDGFDKYFTVPSTGFLNQYGGGIAVYHDNGEPGLIENNNIYNIPRMQGIMFWDDFGIIRNNTFRDNDFRALWLDESRGHLVENNTFEDNNRYSIWVYCDRFCSPLSNDGMIRNNIFRNNLFGIVVSGSADFSENLIDNEFFNTDTPIRNYTDIYCEGNEFDGEVFEC